MKKLVALITVWALLFSCAFALAEGDAAATLQYGDDGDAVTKLQTKLTELYYYSGNISGRYREGTQAAIRNFQTDFGLESTGIADPATQELLYAARYRPLEKGDSGDDVKALQSRLTELGYYNGKISGNYLEGSYYAIHSFQNRSGLPATGKADVKTQELLFDISALAKQAATATPAPASTPAPGQEDDSFQGEAVPEPTAVNVKYTTKLQRGSTGSKVKQLQTRLTELGFYTGPISGNYMNQTKAAVTAFQKHNALTADGITGKETWDMLFNSEEVSLPSDTPKPTPVPTPIPYAVTVDVANQIVTVYGLDGNGDYTQMVRQMICSTGTKAFPSDVGNWTLNGSKARWAIFPKWGDGKAQYWTRINSSIAFHSVIYNSYSTSDLATGSFYALGSRASHGCIRLQVQDAKWVYDNLGKGVVVTITEKLPSDPELTQLLKPAGLDKKTMLAKAAPAPTPAPAYSSGGNPPMPFRTLKKGSQGDDVYWLQMRLTEMGYYKGTVTGGYYGGTANAVKAYQKANGLKADGIAGTKTQNQLYADVLATPTAAPTQTPAPSPTADPYQVPAGNP